MAPVVIVGIDDERGVHVARTMARHGIETIGIAKDPRGVGSRTRACSRIVASNTETPDVIETLVGIGHDLPTRAVLIPCFDTSVSLVSEHRGRLREFYDFALPDHATVDLLQDKSKFYPWAQHAGFAVPNTALLKTLDDCDRAVERLTFPCVLKPPDSKSPRWLQHTRAKVIRIDDPASLRAVYARYRDAAETLVLQEMIDGEDSSVFTCFGYYGAGAEPLVEFTSRKLRQWPPHAGVGCLAEEIRADVVRDTARELMAQLGYRGLCSLEMKRDARDGRFYIIEANVGRPTGRSAHVEGTGVEMLLTLYRDVQGLPLPDERSQPFEQRKWINIRRDMMSALTYAWRRELSPSAWWRSIDGPLVFALLSWRDPVPFLADIVHTLRRGLALVGRR